MSSSYSTFEASDFWRRILVSEFPLVEFCVDLDNCRIFLWKHRFHDALISTPYRDRLAAVWHGTHPHQIDLPSLQRQINLQLSKRTRTKHIVLKDVKPYLDADDEFEYSLTQSHTNCDVKLNEDITTRINRSARKNFRKARDEYGLQFSVNTRGKFEDFFSLYLQTRKRLGVAPFRQSFFRHIFDVMGDKSFIFSCSQDKVSIGFLVCYAHNEELISAHIAYNYDKRQMKVPDFLYLNTFEWGKRNGFTNYRFGGDYNGQKSLIDSKIKLGAVQRKQMDFVAPKTKRVPQEPNPLIRLLLRKVPTRIYSSVGLATLVYFQ